MSSKGAVFERLCRDVLRDAGWFVVKVSDGSDCDLVAVRREGSRSRVLTVEAKSGQQRCRPAQWNRLFMLANEIGADPILADKVPGIAAPRFWLLTGPKSGRLGEPQPRTPFNVDAWNEDAA
jgi:Holliday junction resolvase